MDKLPMDQENLYPTSMPDEEPDEIVYAVIDLARALQVLSLNRRNLYLYREELEHHAILLQEIAKEANDRQ